MALRYEASASKIEELFGMGEKYSLMRDPSSFVVETGAEEPENLVFNFSPSEEAVDALRQEVWTVMRITEEEFDDIVPETDEAYEIMETVGVRILDDGIEYNQNWED